MEIDFKTFEKKSGYEFKNKALLRTAFTHRSYINESRGGKFEHNERLNFSATRCSSSSSPIFFIASIRTKPEGDLTTYRSASGQRRHAFGSRDDLNMNDFLLLSRGEAKDTGRARQFILANTFEAVVGAMYLDAGYVAAKKFIDAVLLSFAEKMIARGDLVDAKSSFQEKAQDKTGITPSYKLMKESGPDHEKCFTIAVFLGKDQIATGEGQSKQEAEQNAAQKAIEVKGW